MTQDKESLAEQNETLSAMIDGEHSEHADSTDVIKDDVLLKKWKSYHLTRDLLRNDMSSDFTFDVSAKVAKAIEQELPIVAPKRSFSELPIISAVVPLIKQSGQLAMVASVTAMVIFGYQTYNQPEVTQPFTTAPPVIGPQGGLAPVSLSTTRAVEQDRMQQLLEQRRQINALIEDHQRQLMYKQTPDQIENNEQENQK